MKIIFRGDPIELERGGALSRQSITLEGVQFNMGVPTDASGLSAKLLAKLENNPHFEIVAEAGVAAVAEAVGAESAPAAEEPEEHASEERISARKGRGGK